MEFGKVPAVIARDLEFEPGNENCYDYFMRNTEQHGDYTCFSHYGRTHLKSEFVADVMAVSAFYKNELGFKQGDVYTIFSPTNVESMILFMALNRLGVIVNFVHPLLPPDNLKEILDFTKSKGIMVLDMFVAKYAETIGNQNIPCTIVVPSCYALPDKYSAKANEEAMAVVAAKIKNCITYPEILKKYADQSVEGVTNNKDAIAIYANGGGTTGKSKTIKLSNGSINELIYMLGAQNTPVEEIGIDTEICSMPFFHAYGFCAGGLSAMHKGAKVVFLPKFDADRFVEIMRTNKVTEFNGVPNMFKKLLAHPDFDGPHLKSIKVMYAGGDDVRPAFVEEFEKVLRKNGSDASICAGWGLTECCAACTTNPPWANKLGTIGKPLPGLNIEIWDEDNKPLPQGKVGQIAVSGPTVMEGYLTEDGPVDAGLYKTEDGTKWVLTGDLAYIDEDGYLWFMGRSKRLVIISGYNVYPGDIEKLLTELDFIKESCAVQGFDAEGKKLIRLYVVADGADENAEEYNRQIIELCSARLDKFSVPRDIRYIDALPRTRLEKVDFMSLTENEPTK